MEIIRAITESDVVNIPIPPEGLCGQGVSEVVSRFPGTKAICLEGPLAYKHGDHYVHADRHYVAELGSGQVVDTCRVPGRRVYRNYEDYFDPGNNEVIFLND